MRTLKWIFVILCFLELFGCASIPSTQPPVTQDTFMTWESRIGVLSNIQHWDLKGLIAVRNARDGFSATWQWHQDTNKNYTIALFGPLGSNSIQLTGSNTGVLLETSDGKKLKSTSPEALLEQQLGWRLPVSNLYYWIRGLPVPGVPAEKQFDKAHRLSVLIQQGWRIEYTRYSAVNQIDLPSKMLLNNTALNVKIIINQWK